MNELKLYVLIEAAADRVWPAMSTAAGLRGWLAETATGDPTTGGTIELGSAMPMISGRHQVRSVEPQRLLALDWQIDRFTADVTLRIEDHGALSRVVLNLRIGDDPELLALARDAMDTELGHLHHIWGYQLMMLKSFVETGTARGRMASVRDGVAETSLTIAAPPERVFRALIDLDDVKKWGMCGEQPVIEPRTGGRYSYGWASEGRGTDGPDHIVEYVDGKKLSFAWHGDPRTLVSFTVEPADGGTGTRLRIQHSGFLTDAKRALEYALGWTSFLYSIDNLVARDEAAPFVSFWEIVGMG